MKTRTAVGGTIIAVAVVAGVFIGKLIPRLGTGDGLGTGEIAVTTAGTKNDSQTPAAGEPAPDLGDIVTDASGQAGRAPVARPVPVESPLLEMRIDGSDYEIAEAVVDGRTRFRRVQLETVVEEALRHKGDAQGIRVRVSRKSSSKAAAENDLRDRLINAGLLPESIEWLGGPAP